MNSDNLKNKIQDNKMKKLTKVTLKAVGAGIGGAISIVVINNMVAHIAKTGHMDYSVYLPILSFAFCTHAYFTLLRKRSELMRLTRELAEWDSLIAWRLSRCSDFDDPVVDRWMRNRVHVAMELEKL